MSTMPVPSGPFETWDPKELGLPRATAVSVALVVLIAGFCYWASMVLAPKSKPAPIQVTVAQLVQLPKPTPPPPPKVIPPPKPLPVVIPKPIPVPSKIVVATKPPPPIRHIYKPVPHPVIQHAPTPPVEVKQPPPAAPSAPPTSGIPIYGREMHAILQANQDVPQALENAGVGGTAIVQITVAPDGHVLSARLVHSSGIKLVDQTALAHALEAHFSPFSADMPSSVLKFTVPIDIEPSTANPDSDDDDSN